MDSSVLVMIVAVEVVDSLEPRASIRDGYFGFLYFPGSFKRGCITSLNS